MRIGNYPLATLENSIQCEFLCIDKNRSRILVVFFMGFRIELDSGELGRKIRGKQYFVLGEATLDTARTDHD